MITAILVSGMGVVISLAAILFSRMLKDNSYNSFTRDSFFMKNERVGSFFWRYYLETKDFPLPHLMIFAHFGSNQPARRYRLAFDHMGRLVLSERFLDKGVNILEAFHNPFNPTKDELILWDIDNQSDYEAIMSTFCRNWRDKGGNSWTPL